MSRSTLKSIHDLIKRTQQQPKRQVDSSEVNDKLLDKKPARQELPVELVFLNNLEKTIEKINTRENYSSTYFKPSSMSCERNMYYTAMGVGIGEILAKVDSCLCGITETGSHRHEDIQSYIEKMKENGFNWEYVDVEEYIEKNNLSSLEVVKKVNHETKVLCPSLNTIFLTDGIVKYGDNHFIFEFKTEDCNKWYKRSNVDISHIDQAIAYCTLFNLDSAIFVYENRNTCQKKSYLFTPTDEQRKSFISKINKVLSCCETHTLPEPNRTNKCKYCPYEAYCKGDVNVDK